MMIYATRMNYSFKILHNPHGSRNNDHVREWQNAVILSHIEWGWKLVRGLSAASCVWFTRTQRLIEWSAMTNVRASLMSTIQIANIYHGTLNVHHEGRAGNSQDFSVTVWDDIRQFRVSEKTLSVTVTKLEALVKLSDSLAKMMLLDDTTRAHVRETIRLFLVLTMKETGYGGTQGHLFSSVCF